MHSSLVTDLLLDRRRALKAALGLGVGVGAGLAGSLARGRRPSFDGAAPPEEAEPLVAALVEGLRAEGLHVATGRFRAAMQVELVNDGPVTFVLDVRPGGAE